jgi:hypothetical protein
MKITIDIDIETIVREEIRNYIKENLVINNISQTVVRVEEEEEESKKEVKDTLFDFNVKTNLGERIKKMQLTSFNGFDHTWLFNNQKVKGTLRCQVTKKRFLSLLIRQYYILGWV